MSDAERIFGFKVPDDSDANTLSGLCILAIGEMPLVDNVVEEYGFRFTIIEVEKHRIGRILVERTAFIATDSIEATVSNQPAADGSKDNDLKQEEN